MLPQRVVVVCGCRLKLLLIGQVLVRQQILCAAITTEKEAEAALKAHQPGLLVVADPLEEGDAFNLCRKARQQQPNVKILLILSKENARLAFQEIDALVDSAIYELDLGGDDYPLVKAFIAILRAGRYRSPSLQQPQHRLNVPPALEHEQPSSEPQLTPREQEVLDLIGRGLSDRQIGTSLGSATKRPAPTSKQSDASWAATTASRPRLGLGGGDLANHPPQMGRVGRTNTNYRPEDVQLCRNRIIVMQPSRALQKLPYMPPSL
jgi:DNA-binding NarL/FixJ family response regulator